VAWDRTALPVKRKVRSPLETYPALDSVVGHAAETRIRQISDRGFGIPVESAWWQRRRCRDCARPARPGINSDPQANHFRYEAAFVSSVPGSADQPSHPVSDDFLRWNTDLITCPTAENVQQLQGPRWLSSVDTPKPHSHPWPELGRRPWYQLIVRRSNRCDLALG
jgi:hypothetical protein